MSDHHGYGSVSFNVGIKAIDGGGGDLQTSTETLKLKLVWFSVLMVLITLCGTAVNPSHAAVCARIMPCWPDRCLPGVACVNV